jgi:hypothetical protein
MSMATLSTIFSGGIGVTAFALAWAYMIWQFVANNDFFMGGGNPLFWWWA